MTRICAIVLFLMALGVAPARADVPPRILAVLVGVGDYLTLDADLHGPPNDVASMARALLARGVAPDAIRMLTDAGTVQDPRLSPAGVPTRAAILAALDAVAAEAAAGDTVVFHFSGHGSQAPDRDGDEAGGFDEILLPADAAGWNGGTGVVENAISDDELGVWARGLTARGVRLIGILDACHSATGFRDVVGAGVARWIDPSTLGVPAEAGAPAESARVAPPVEGEFAFLYSSQSDQRSFEFAFGEADDPSAWHGAFTAHLVRVLDEAPEATWGQVLAAVAAGMRQGVAVQTPDGEGPMLEQVVFGSSGGGAQRVAVTGGRLAAGVLQGFSEGDVVEVFASAAGDTRIGSAVLAEVTARGARLVGEGLPEAGFARLVQPGPMPAMRLAPPVGAGADLVLEAVAGSDVLKLDVAQPDAVPVIGADGLLLAGPDGVVDPEGPGSSPRPLPDEDVAAFLERAAHAWRLRRVLAVAERAAGQGFTFAGPPVAVTVERRAGAAGPGGCMSPAPGAPEPGFDPAAGVEPCDELWLSITNRSARAQDVTVFYIGADLTVSVVFPQPGLSNRIALGETHHAGLRVEASGGGWGRDEIVAVAVPAAPRAPRTDLSGLADPATARAMPGGGVGGMLAGALSGEAASRSLSLTAGPPDLTIVRIAVAMRAGED